MLFSEAQTAFELWIDTNTIKSLSRNELSELITAHSLAEQARDKFLLQQITFDEYIAIIETCGVHIDSYLSKVEQNLDYLKVF